MTISSPIALIPPSSCAVFLFSSLRDLLKASRGNHILCCPHSSVIARSKATWQSHPIIPTIFIFAFCLCIPIFAFCIYASTVNSNIIHQLCPHSSYLYFCICHCETCWKQVVAITSTKARTLSLCISTSDYFTTHPIKMGKLRKISFFLFTTFRFYKN